MERKDELPSVEETFALLKMLCPGADKEALHITAVEYIFMPDPKNPNQYITVKRSDEEKEPYYPLDLEKTKRLIEKLMNETPKQSPASQPQIHGQNKWWAQRGSKRRSF
jgi:hypothetical protein